MINDVELKKILKDNNLTFPRRIREDLKEHTQYNELVEVLSILKKLNISPRMIEKYPAILYTTGDNIRENYRLLKYNKLFNYTQEELIKILASDNELVKTIHKYLLKSCTNEFINMNINVLSTTTQRIKEVERYSKVLTKESMISAITSNLTITEIHENIMICKENKIDITPKVFNRTPLELKTVIDLCTTNNILVSDSILTKTATEIEQIFKLFKRMETTVFNELFYCPMDKMEGLLYSIANNKKTVNENLYKTTTSSIKEVLEIYDRFNLNIDYKAVLYDINKILEIVELCNSYNVKVSEKMFDRELDDIEEIIKYCKEKDLIIRDTYFERTKKEIEIIHNTCSMSIKRDDATYKRDIKEILAILAYCESENIKFSPTMFNNNLSEIQEIIKMCEKRHVPVSNNVFKTNHNDLDDIITYLKRQPIVIPFTPLACNRTPYEVTRIKEILKEYKVAPIPEMFLRTPYEVEQIIKLTKNEIDSKYFQYPVSKLKDILGFCKKKGIIISPSMMDRTTGEIEDLLEICNNKKIEVKDPVYLRTPYEAEEIIKYCEEKKLEISADCFRKNPEQFKETVASCEKLGIPPVGEVFKRTPEEIGTISKIYEKMLKQDPINNSFATTPDEVEKIISLLLENNIEITGVVFRKKAKDLKDTIDFVKNKYGQEFLLPQIIIYDKDHIDRVFSYLGGRKVLNVVKTCPYILRLPIKEIVDRDSYIITNGGKSIEEGKFNQIFNLSKKKFQELKEQKTENKKGI